MLVSDIELLYCHCLPQTNKPIWYIHSILNKFATEYCKYFPPHLEIVFVHTTW